MTRWSLLIGLLGLLLALPPAAAAHGGDQTAGPAATWMLALLYGQLAALPFVGLFLVRQASDAWFGPARYTQGDMQ